MDFNEIKKLANEDEGKVIIVEGDKIVAVVLSYEAYKSMKERAQAVPPQHPAQQPKREMFSVKEILGRGERDTLPHETPAKREESASWENDLAPFDEDLFEDLTPNEGDRQEEGKENRPIASSSAKGSSGEEEVGELTLDDLPL